MKTPNISPGRALAALLALVVVTSPVTGHAATYYVDATGGNNANDGLATTTAWQTVAKVTSTTFAAGDTILFKRGETFTGNLQFSNETGTSGSRITVGAYGTGANPVLHAGGVGRTLDIRNSASYMTFENLTLRGASTDSVYLFTGTFDNLIFQHLDVASSTAFNITASTTNLLLSDISIHDVTQGITHPGYGANNTYQDITVTGGVNGLSYSGSTAATTTGITIDNLNVSNTSSSGIAFRRLANSTLSNVTVASSSLSGISIDLGLSDTDFEDVSVSSSTQYGLTLNATGPITFSDVSATGNGLHGFSLSGPGAVTADGIYSAHNGGEGFRWAGSSSLLLSDSVLEHNTSNGLSLPTSGSRATTTNTTARYNSNDGFNISSGVNAVFDQTVSDTNGDDGVGPDGDGYSWHGNSTGSLSRSLAINNKKGGVVNVDTSNVDIYNNVFVHDTTGTLPMVNILSTSTARIYNNTFYNPSGQGTAIEPGDAASSTVANNVVVGFQTGMRDFTTGTFTERNNVVYGVTGTAFSGFTAATTSTTTNPLLVDPDGGDYSLSGMSAAIDAGYDGLCPADDYDGEARTGTCDIGAFEYQYVAPAASFTSSATDRNVTFTDTSDDADGVIVAWEWDFGDGATSTAQSPSHAYTSDGSYDVELTVTDNHGEQDTAGDTVAVAQGTQEEGSSSGRRGSSGSKKKSVKATTPIANSVPTIPAAVPALGQGAGEAASAVRDLTLGSTGEDVRALQRFLNLRGFAVSPVAGASGSSGYETDYFGELTRAALARFQAGSGISPAAGYFGPITRARIAAGI